MISIKPHDNITPTIVKQYSYCPVSAWIKTWLLVEEPATDSMRRGKETTTPPQGIGQIYIKSKQGTTALDEIVEEKESKTIVEKKAYKSYNYSRYIEQTITSYIIAKEKIANIRNIKLIIQGRIKTIEITEDLVSDVEKIIDKVREMLLKERNPPKPYDTRKCKSCWYKKYCPYW